MRGHCPKKPLTMTKDAIRMRAVVAQYGVTYAPGERKRRGLAK